MSDDLLNHPKTVRLRDLLKTRLAEAYLVRLWIWALQYGPGGDLSRFTDTIIARGCGWPGAPERFVGALVEAGFLDRGDNGLMVHDWADHSGQYEVQTARGRERQRRYRERGHNADVTVTSRPEVKGIEGKGIEGEKIKPSRAKSTRDSVSPDFERFWNCYPNKRGKANAVKVWKKLMPDPALQEQILGAVERQKAWRDWTKDGGAYIPHASTWLNGKRWEDGPSEIDRSWVLREVREGTP